MTKEQFISAIERVSKENVNAGRVMAFLIAIEENLNIEDRVTLMRTALDLSEPELAMAVETLERHGLPRTSYRN